MEESSVLSCAIKRKRQGTCMLSKERLAVALTLFFCFLGCESHVNCTAKGAFFGMGIGLFLYVCVCVCDGMG